MNKHGWLAVVLLSGAASAHAGIDWASWWRTPDQQAQAMLQAGDAANAARTYTDPQRKAFAELKAGHYQAAAKAYEGVRGRDALYNRGNALAHAGDLKTALQAYDEALKLDPQDKDVRHNRDLVAKALQAQPPQQPQQQQQSPKQPSGSGQSPPPPDQQSASQPGQAGQPKSPDKQADKQSDKKDGNGAPKASAQPPSKATPASAPEKKSGTPESAKAADQPSPSTPVDDAAQAKREVAQRQAQPSSTASAPPGQSPTADALAKAKAQAANADQPRTEQSLSEAQWLRRIPDDPGGLLRRKFLIQHMLRHPEATP